MLKIRLEALARVVWQGKETKDIHIGRKEVKSFPLENVIVLHLGATKDYRKLLGLINTFSKVARYRSNLQKK